AFRPHGRPPRRRDRRHSARGCAARAQAAGPAALRDGRGLLRVSERNGGAVGVLVADDHPVFRRGVAKAIERRAELTLAGEHGDGEAALSAIRERAPDIALLDVVMPVMTGLEVLTAV